VKQQIEEQFSNVLVNGASAGDLTGEFEVKNAKTGRVYHSKLNGDGVLPDNAEGMLRLLEALKADGATPKAN
jgi:hypothetical protein